MSGAEGSLLSEAWHMPPVEEATSKRCALSIKALEVASGATLPAAFGSQPYTTVVTLCCKHFNGYTLTPTF